MTERDSDAWRTGVAWLDDQHQRLEELTRYAVDAAKQQGNDLLDRLEALRVFCQGHFQEEEAQMARLRFPGEVEHRFQHDYLLHELTLHEQRLRAAGSVDGDALAQFLVVWYGHHVEELDQELARYLLDHDTAVEADEHESIIIAAPPDLQRG